MFRTFGHSRPAVALGALWTEAIRVPLVEADYVNSALLWWCYGPKLCISELSHYVFCRGPAPSKERGEMLVNEHAAQYGVQVPSPCSLSVCVLSVFI